MNWRRHGRALPGPATTSQQPAPARRSEGAMPGRGGRAARWAHTRSHCTAVGRDWSLDRPGNLTRTDRHPRQGHLGTEPSMRPGRQSRGRAASGSRCVGVSAQMCTVNRSTAGTGPGVSRGCTVPPHATSAGRAHPGGRPVGLAAPGRSAMAAPGRRVMGECVARADHRKMAEVKVNGRGDAQRPNRSGRLTVSGPSRPPPGTSGRSCPAFSAWHPRGPDPPGRPA